MSKKTNIIKKVNIIKKMSKKNIVIICITLVVILIITFAMIIFLQRNKEDVDVIEVATLAAINIEDPTKQYNSIYEDVYYYDSRNEQRYIEYQAINLNLSVEDVVWRVNTKLDKVFYTDINETENINDNLLLVNKYNKLPDDYIPTNLEKLSSGQYLQHDTKIAFEEMKASAKKQGYIINDVSGYRSIDSQEELYNFYLSSYSQKLSDTFSSRAGHSEHHTGQAIDITGSFGDILDFVDTKESKWIKENAYEYGFIIRYPKGYEHITGYKSEPWHIRYVGTEIATDMIGKGINTLEEYYEKYIVYNNYIKL